MYIYILTTRMNYLSRKYHAVIPLQARFEEPPVFPHGLMGICISKNAIIGKNCTIFQNVTIGSNNFQDSKGFGSPEIGDDVFIGANSVLIGNIKIGNGVRIGAGCSVFQSIPDNATVVCQPPRVILHESKRDNAFQGVKVK